MEEQRVPLVQAALLGLGTVGGGVYKLIERQAEELPHKTGARVAVRKILVRDRNKERPGIPPEKLTDDWQEILSDPEIRIVIEVMGGIEPARTYIEQALRAGKQVVTANKDLLAEYGEELTNLANRQGCDLMFEAAVAGGIPIIRPLKNSLVGNHIEEVMGIVNGTTNFILSRMSQDGMDYQEALELAAKLGYAEADPTADVEGLDAGRKMAIMASLAFHTRVVASDVYTEGISKISAKDIRYAKEFGYVVKLLGIARETEGGIEVKVHPALIPDSHPLAAVGDSFNAVFVRGDAVGDTMFYGRGAGEFPTASAVLGDVVDEVRHILGHSTGRCNGSFYKNLPVKPVGETDCRFFLRMQVEDKPGVLAGICSVLGNNGVSIAQVVQKKKQRTAGVAELVIITDSVKERYFRDALTIFGGMSLVRKISSVIRVYE